MSTEEDVFQADKFQEAIAAAGFGKFNIFLLVVSFFGTMAIIFASTTVSFIMPSAECDLDLSLAEQGMLNSMAYYGMLVSGVPWAILSDFQGRKIVLVVAHVLDAISVFICALSQGPIQLMIFKFINGMCISGGYSCMMTYLSETHSEKYRQIVLLVIGLFLAISALLLPLSAMLILPAKWIIDIGGFAFRSWNLYIALTGIPSLVVGTAFIILPESPKYSMRRKRYDIANETFATIYHFNTGEPKDNYPVALPPRADAGIIRTIDSTLQSAKNNIVSALTSGAIWQMLLVCLIDFCVLTSQNTLRLWKPSFFAAARNFDFSNSTTICPFLDTFVEDQKSRATRNTTKHRSCSFILDQRSYLANVFVSLVSIVGYVAAIVLVRKVGIKLLLVSALFICCFVGICLIFASTEELLITVVALYLAFENLSSTAVINVIVQLFPTQIRNTVLSTAQFVGRIGSSIGNSLFPLILTCGCAAPVIWLSVVVGLAGIAGIFIKNPANVPFK